MALRREDAIRYEGYPDNRFVFLCSVCGVEIVSQHHFLKEHSGKCPSCSHRKLPYGAAFRNLVDNRHKRKVPVTLTYDQFVGLCKLPDCHYCHKPLNRTTNRNEPHYRSYLLDRKDNNQGYDLSNCVPCCWKCNQTKGNRFTYEEFLAISKGLREFRETEGKPHWTDDFGWDDGDSNPDPYYGEMLLTAR